LLLLKEGYGASSVHGAVEMSKLQKLVKRNLVSIGQPLIIFQSKADTLVDPKTEDYVLKHISSSEKKGFLYEKSSHVMSLDVDREAIFKETLAFFAAHQPALL
jgi:carboxylesterase